MKKLMLIGLMAIGSVAALAAPAKTSKPVILSDSQMESLKGQGSVWVWTWDEYWGFYVLSGMSDTGPGGPSFTMVFGGPNPGYYPAGYQP